MEAESQREHYQNYIIFLEPGNISVEGHQFVLRDIRFHYGAMIFCVGYPLALQDYIAVSFEQKKIPLMQLVVL